MSSKMRPEGFSFTATFFALVLVAGSGAIPDARAKAAPAPQRVALQVVYGENVGTESVREEIELRIIREIEHAGCFAAIERYETEDEGEPSEADVLFRIILSGLQIREDWEESIATRTSPNRPPGDQADKVVTTIKLNVRFDVLLLPDAFTLRTRSYHHEESYRPTCSEDPRYEVRRMVIEEISRNARSFACKGSRKLSREIERARAASAD
jgi:hypothetical protein